MRPLSYREAHGCRAVCRCEELHGLAPAREGGFPGGAGEQLHCRTETRASRSRWRRGGRVVEHLLGGAGREGSRVGELFLAMQGRRGGCASRAHTRELRIPPPARSQAPSRSPSGSRAVVLACERTGCWGRNTSEAYVLQSFYTKAMVEGYFWDKKGFKY